MTEKFAGKVAVVTGGASGIGRRTVELLVEGGATVVLGDRNAALLDEVRAALGERCATVVADVSQEADVEALVRTAVDTYGRLDLAVNSAGVGTLGAVDQHPLDRWQGVIDVSLTGVFLSIKHEARAMQESGSGAIVNLSSIYGRQPGEGMVAYCCAKAGVDMLTRVSAIELGPKGIRVNAIAPGFVETPMTSLTQPKSRQAYVDSIPLGRPGHPDDIARGVLYLLSEDASWVNGETLVVDGGEVHREAPRLLTRDR